MSDLGHKGPLVNVNCQQRRKQNIVDDMTFKHGLHDPFVVITPLAFLYIIMNCILLNFLVLLEVPIVCFSD